MYPGGIRGANPPQRRILEAGLLSSGFNCLLQLPTGGGKTWLAEQAIRDVLEAKGRAVYLTPLRALAAELVDRWRVSFASHVIGCFTGDTGREGRGYPVPFSEAQLLVMTPERLDACTRAWRSHWNWIPEVHVAVVDEFHLLGDASRGPRLEGALSRFCRLNPLARVLALSATIGNRAELAEWLGGVEFGSDWRPIPLTWRTVTYKRATDKPALLLDTARRCASEGGQSLVFVQSRRRAEQLSQLLTANGMQSDHHHAGLDGAARRRVEDGIRTGTIRVVVATGTLEMGLNLPVRQVVLYDLQGFDGRDFVPLPVTTVWQRAGRAGRPGLDSQGEVVLFRPSWDRIADKYPTGQFEPVRSGLASEAALAEQVLAEVGSGLARTEAQITRVFGGSLAARQGTLPPINRVLNTMRQAQMVQDESRSEGNTHVTKLRVTPLGRIAVRQMLGPETVHRLQTSITSRSDGLTFLDILLIACATPDCQPLIPADFEELETLSAALSQERSTVLSGGPSSARRWLLTDDPRLLAVIKTAVIAREWTRTGDADCVAGRWGCYPFEIRRLCESLARVLTALVAVVRLGRPESETTNIDMPDDGPTLADRTSALTAMIEHGLDEQTVTLTFVPGVAGAFARRLRDAGIRDVEDLALADVETIEPMRGVSRKRLETWVSASVDLVKCRSAGSLRETGPTLGTVSPDWPSDIDPYRFWRATELTVQAADEATYVVRGGLEPHRVVGAPGGTLACDCADYVRGNVCKHALAVRLHKRERAVTRLLKHLRQHCSLDSDKLDLFALWSGPRTNSGPGGSLESS